MDKIKELTDFYMWMQENEYDHNIRSRVERKAEMYLSRLNVGQIELSLCKHCDNKKALHSEATGLCPNMFKHFEL